MTVTFLFHNFIHNPLVMITRKKSIPNGSAITKGWVTKQRDNYLLKQLEEIKKTETEEEKAEWEERCRLLKERHDLWRATQIKNAERERERKQKEEEERKHIEREKENQKRRRLQEAVNRMNSRIEEEKAKEKAARDLFQIEQVELLQMERKKEEERQIKYEEAVKKAQKRILNREKRKKKMEEKLFRLEEKERKKKEKERIKKEQEKKSEMERKAKEHKKMKPLIANNYNAIDVQFTSLYDNDSLKSRNYKIYERSTSENSLKFPSSVKDIDSEKEEPLKVDFNLINRAFASVRCNTAPMSDKNEKEQIDLITTLPPQRKIDVLESFRFNYPHQEKKKEIKQSHNVLLPKIEQVKLPQYGKYILDVHQTRVDEIKHKHILETLERNASEILKSRPPSGGQLFWKEMEISDGNEKYTLDP